VKANRIGAPAVQKHICEAARDSEAITLKTLQRFRRAAISSGRAPPLPVRQGPRP
jgi:hypothetical protein